MVESRVGQLTAPLTPLIENRGTPTTVLDTSSTVDEATDIEEELQENEDEDKLEN